MTWKQAKAMGADVFILSAFFAVITIVFYALQ